MYQLLFCCDGCYALVLGLMCRYDSRVKAMEVDERPTEQYTDIGGLDKQIQEVRWCLRGCWSGWVNMR